MKNEKKQTAVEYLIHHIRQDVFVHSKSTKEWNQVFQQAKKMDKEQHRVTAEDFYYGSHSFKNFDQYYEEIYGNNHIGDVNKMVGGEQ